jgi:hypothetical protein
MLQELLEIESLKTSLFNSGFSVLTEGQEEVSGVNIVIQTELLR